MRRCHWTCSNGAGARGRLTLEYDDGLHADLQTVLLGFARLLAADAAGLAMGEMEPESVEVPGDVPPD